MKKKISKKAAPVKSKDSKKKAPKETIDKKTSDKLDLLRIFLGTSMTLREIARTLDFTIDQYNAFAKKHETLLEGHIRKSKRGTPRILSDSQKEEAIEMSSLGLTQKEISKVLRCDSDTIGRERKRDAFFCGSMDNAKLISLMETCKSLKNRANGFHKTETKAISVSDGMHMGSHVETVEVEKYYPPDTKAIMFRLTNIRPDLFKHKQEVTTIDAYDQMSEDELIAEFKKNATQEDITGLIKELNEK